MKKVNIGLDWLIKILVYSFILVITSLIFKNTIKIDTSMLGMWAFLASIIIYILNKTIKPLLTWLTLPLTGITFGLFYPFINVIILKIADLILGIHFETGEIFMTCLVAILIGWFTAFMDKCIVKSILGRK